MPALAPERLPRRNLTLYNSTQQILENLRHQLEAASDSELVRVALRYLEQLVIDQEEGRTLLIQSTDGASRTITYTALQADVGEDREFVKRNIVVNQGSIERMEDLKRALGVSSDSELVRRALRYLNLIVDETHKGSKFYLMEDGNQTLVRMDVLGKRSNRWKLGNIFKGGGVPAGGIKQPSFAGPRPSI